MSYDLVDNKFKKVFFSIIWIQVSNWTKTYRNSKSEGSRISLKQLSSHPPYSRDHVPYFNYCKISLELKEIKNYVKVFH